MEDQIKEIINLVLREVREQGMDLMSEYDGSVYDKAVDIVYDAIKDEL